MKRIILLCGLLVLLPEKSVRASIPPEVRRVLPLSGKNADGLEALLRRYKRKGATERYRAACFLLENAALHRRHTYVAEYDKRLSTWVGRADSACYALTASWNERDWADDVRVRALDTLAARFRSAMGEVSFDATRTARSGQTDLAWLDSAFLSRHLDHVFALREKYPRLKAMPWEEFRDFVLPYASLPFADRPEPFDAYSARYAKYLHTEAGAAPGDVAGRYARCVSVIMKFLPAYPVKGLIGMDASLYYGAHDCVNMAYHAANAFRACGVPALVGYNSLYKVRNGHHFHIGMPDEQGDWYTFTLDDGEPRRYDAAFRKSTNIFYVYDGVRQQNPWALRAKGEPIPVNLSDPCIEDHTDRVMKTVSLTLPFEAPVPNRLAYLAAYHFEFGIVPVTWGLVDAKKKCVTFGKVVPDNLYFPVFCGPDSSYVPFGDPFWVESDSVTAGPGFRIDSLLSGPKTKVETVLERVYPQNPAVEKLKEAVVGTSVVASDRRDFRDADTLGRIVAVPGGGWQVMELANTRAYRYYKVEAPASDYHLRFSEVEFLTADSLPYANVRPVSLGIKTGGGRVRLLSEPYEDCVWRAEYDGDVTTAPEAYPVVWFLLERPQVVTHFCYRVKSDGRSVEPGAKYQLYAWDGREWNIVRTFLVLDENPALILQTKTLYRLHRVGSSEEELPFVVNDRGGQVFVHRKLLSE